MALTTEQKQAIDLAAKRAAEGTLKRTLLLLGINASTPEAVKSFQQDIAFVHHLRVNTASKSLTFWATSVAAIAGMLGSALTLAAQYFLGM